MIWIFLFVGADILLIYLLSELRVALYRKAYFDLHDKYITLREAFEKELIDRTESVRNWNKFLEKLTEESKGQGTD